MTIQPCPVRSGGAANSAATPEERAEAARLQAELVEKALLVEKGLRIRTRATPAERPDGLTRVADRLCG